MILTKVITGAAISWASLRTTLFGTLPEGILGISYEDMQEMQNEYGQGTQPYQRSYGKNEYNASVTVTMELLESIIKSAPNNKIQLIPPTAISMIFVDPQTEIATGIIKTLTSVQFKGYNFDSKSGDMRTEITLPLIIGGIQ